MLQIINLTKIYKVKDQEKRALDNITLSFPQSGMFFILGGSGSGKTTLLKMLSALDTYDQGEIIVDGTSLSAMTEEARDAFRHTCVGIIDQEYSLIDDFSVYDNIALACELQREKISIEKISAVMSQLGIDGLQGKKPSELSESQKLKVITARAFIKKPKILLADEPTIVLDAEGGDELMQQLKKVSDDSLVIIMSQDKTLAEQYGNMIIELRNGRVLSDAVAGNAEQENGQINLENAHIKTGRAFILGMKTAVKSPVRLICLCLSFFIALSFIGTGLVVISFKAENSIAYSIAKLEDEWITLQKFDMNDDDVQSFEKNFQTPGLAFSMCNMDYSANIYKSPNDTDDEFGVDRCAALTYENIQSLNLIVKGNIPQAEDEVVISQSVADEFCKYGYKGIQGGSNKISGADDLIGKNLQISIDRWNPNARQYTFMIVGVVDLSNAFYFSPARLEMIKQEILNEASLSVHRKGLNATKNLHFQPYELHQEEGKYSWFSDSETQLQNDECIMALYNFLEIFGSESLPKVYQDWYKAETIEALHHSESLWGEYIDTHPEWAQSVADTDKPLTSQERKEILDTMQRVSYSGYEYEGVYLGQVLCEAIADMLKEKEFAVTLENEFTYTVAALNYAPAENYNNDEYVYVVQDQMVAMYKDWGGVYRYIMGRKPTDMSLLKLVGKSYLLGDDGSYLYPELEGFRISIPNEILQSIKTAEDGLKSGTMQLVLFLTAGTFFIVALILLTLFTKRCICLRVKEINILKSLGLNNRGIQKIFLVENGIVGFVGYILGVIGSIIGMTILNRGYVYGAWQTSVLFVFSVWIPFALLGIAGILTIAGTIFGFTVKSEKL